MDVTRKGDVCRIGDPFEAAFIEARQVEGVCIAVVDERILTDHQVEAAKARLGELAAFHHGRLGVSLAKTDGSSMGFFAALLQLQRRCEDSGGRMVLFNVPDETVEALQRFGLIDSFTCADDLEQAVDTLRRPPPRKRPPSWLGQLMGRRAA